MQIFDPQHPMIGKLFSICKIVRYFPILFTCAENCSVSDSTWRHRSGARKRKTQRDFGPIKFVPEQFYLFNIFDVFLLTKIKHQIDFYVHDKLHKVVPPTPRFFLWIGFPRAPEYPHLEFLRKSRRYSKVKANHCCQQHRGWKRKFLRLGLREFS